MIETSIKFFGVFMNQEYGLPSPPEIAEEDLRRCRESGDYCPIFFEWYKYVGLLCNFFASIRQDSPAVRTMDHIQYAVLIGLLNRCSRLMFANVALSHNGLFGETTALIDRCIFESCVKASWLCHSDSDDYFSRFVADGLKTEIELKKKINNNISARDGCGVLEIERRMLSSIDKYIASSGMAESQIIAAKKLPDLAAMIEGLGQDRLTYIVGQKLGSHHVHGTWPSLYMHYLERDDYGLFFPRDHDCVTHVNQYVMISLVVLNAMSFFVKFVLSYAEDITPMESLLDSVAEKIKVLNEEVVGNDFAVAGEI